MAYVELTEVKQVLAAVDSPTDQDWQGTAAELSDGLIQLHIDDAQAQVDTVLNKTYKTPFDPVPALIRAITRAIACYLADLTYRKSVGYRDTNYPVLFRYQWALNQLEMLRTNKISLDNTGGDYQDDGGVLIAGAESLLFPASEYLKPARYWISDY